MSCLRVNRSEFAGLDCSMGLPRTREVSSGLKTKYIPARQTTPAKSLPFPLLQRDGVVQPGSPVKGVQSRAVARPLTGTHAGARGKPALSCSARGKGGIMDSSQTPSLVDGQDDGNRRSHQSRRRPRERHHQACEEMVGSERQCSLIAPGSRRREDGRRLESFGVTTQNGLGEDCV